MSELSPRERVKRAMEEIADLYGFNESYARLYGTLFFEEEMTLDELSEETGLSKSTASRGMSTLENLYLAESHKKQGHGKTKFYTPERNLEKAFMKVMENEAAQEIEIMREALEEAEKEMEQKGDKEGLEKVRRLKEFYERAEKFVKTLTRLPPKKALARAADALKAVIP
ncbi:MAG: GbsR/MarR family transcriptional regulator [Candidatus Nanohalobium sp.]